MYIPVEYAYFLFPVLQWYLFTCYTYNETTGHNFFVNYLIMDDVGHNFSRKREVNLTKNLFKRKNNTQSGQTYHHLFHFKTLYLDVIHLMYKNSF